MKIIIKIIKFYLGKSLAQRFPYHITWYKKLYHNIITFIRKSFVIASLILSIGLISSITAIVYRNTSPKVVQADKEIVQVPIEVEALNIPILKKIIMCESNGKHYAKNGQVITRANTNNTVDIGIAQINLFYWGKTASDMKLDLTNEKDNLAFAKWLFMQKGSDPWTASKPCWSK